MWCLLPSVFQESFQPGLLGGMKLRPMNPTGFLSPWIQSKNPDSERNKIFPGLPHKEMLRRTGQYLHRLLFLSLGPCPLPDVPTGCSVLSSSEFFPFIACVPPITDDYFLSVGPACCICLDQQFVYIWKSQTLQRLWRPLWTLSPLPPNVHRHVHVYKFLDNAETLIPIKTCALRPTILIPPVLV